MTKVTPFLMFNDQLEAAMDFYAATFPEAIMTMVKLDVAALERAYREA